MGSTALQRERQTWREIYTNPSSQRGLKGQKLLSKEGHLYRSRLLTSRANGEGLVVQDSESSRHNKGK